MKTSSIALALTITSLFVFHNLPAQDTQSADGTYRKLQRLALKWYGEGAKIREVKEWRAIRITVTGYDTDGERRWLVLFPEAPIGKYNAYVVPMMIESQRNNSITMSKEARNALLEVSALTVISGVSVEKKINDLVIPYLLRTGLEKSKEWTQGTYYYFPVENIHEYILDLTSRDSSSDAIPLAASVYVDDDDLFIHRKITGVLTVFRGKSTNEK